MHRTRRSWRWSVLIVALLVFPVFSQPAEASCKNKTPDNGTAWRVGQQALPDSYRGIHGGISWASGTPVPISGQHINVTIGSKWNNTYWSQIGWQMGDLVRLPSGALVQTTSPTVYFEGIDAVADYRDVYGAAESLGRYEVSEGGAIGAYWKYIAWFQRAGVWYQAGYAELNGQYTQQDAWGEATDLDRLPPDYTCVQLSANTSTRHELGSPDALLLLTDVWHDWTTAYPMTADPDNAVNVYKYTSWSSYDHFDVGGP